MKVRPAISGDSPMAVAVCFGELSSNLSVCVCVGFKTGHVQLPAKALDTIKGAGLGRDICLGLRASVRDINVAHGRASLRLIASAQVRFRGPPGHKLDPN